jgi:hypothetical protein
LGKIYLHHFRKTFKLCALNCAPDWANEFLTNPYGGALVIYKSDFSTNMEPLRGSNTKQIAINSKDLPVAYLPLSVLERWNEGVLK